MAACAQDAAVAERLQVHAHVITAAALLPQDSISPESSLPPFMSFQWHRALLKGVSDKKSPVLYLPPSSLMLK